METAHRQESLPRAQGARPECRVWKNEQLVKREEGREGKSFPDRRGGLVKAELRSHGVRGGNKAVHCCVALSAWGIGQTVRMERPDLRRQAEPRALWLPFQV